MNKKQSCFHKCRCWLKREQQQVLLAGGNPENKGGSIHPAAIEQSPPPGNPSKQASLFPLQHSHIIGISPPAIPPCRQPKQLHLFLMRGTELDSFCSAVTWKCCLRPRPSGAASGVTTGGAARSTAQSQRLIVDLNLQLDQMTPGAWNTN